MLEQTGESLGSALRSDWAEFTKAPLSKTLESTVRTKDMYEFPAGLRRNIDGDREIGVRAVLSGCAAER